jgi:hypothetical protein
VGGSLPVPDTRNASWSPFQLTITDGDIFIFWVIDHDSDTPPYGDALMPACCQIIFDGMEGLDKLKSGQGMCAWAGGSLMTTFVAR